MENDGVSWRDLEDIIINIITVKKKKCAILVGSEEIRQMVLQSKVVQDGIDAKMIDLFKVGNIHPDDMMIMEEEPIEPMKVFAQPKGGSDISHKA